jgi:hypothetical protein
MTTTPELIRFIQSEREAHIRNDHLARIASCARACCHPTLFDRVAAVLGRDPASCRPSLDR